MDRHLPMDPGGSGGRSSVVRAIAGLGLALALTLGVAGYVDVRGPGAATAATTDSEAVVAAVADTANPGVVTVLTLMSGENGAYGQTQVPGDADLPEGEYPLGSGSGYIIDMIGHVVTNNHVVEGGTNYQVTFEDGTSAMASLVGRDPYQDVAVLQLELESGQQVPGTVSWGDSDAVEPGDPVIAIGTPYGEYANTVSAGNVNGTERELDSGYGYGLPNLIQHDAAIYPGSSGGPLLNADGEVIGMNVAQAYGGGGIRSGEGLNFAIESNAIRTVVDELIEDGNYERSYLGIQAQLNRGGIGVEGVESDGPAAAAGLEAGDVIVAIDGERINLREGALDPIIFERRPGDVVTLTVDRSGEELTFELTLGERPTSTPQ